MENKYKILVVNPGSTSTKLAIFENYDKIWSYTVRHAAEDLAKFFHPIEQLEYRDKAIRNALKENGYELDFDAIVGRGGLLKPTPAGVYEVGEKVKHDLIHAKLEHVCNLGGLIAADLAVDCPRHCYALIADPEVVDEMIPVAKVTGLPEINRKSIFHALNTRAVGRAYAESIGKKYEDLNLLMVHIGGGISVSSHCKGKVIDTNNALNGDGPFTPERAGALPSLQLAELCFSGKYTFNEVKKMITGKGGCAAHLGTTDMIDIENRALAGEEPFKFIFESMAFAVAREMGARAVALKGQIDAIIVTGGIAYSKPFVDLIKDWAGFLGKFVIIPGEDEMGSLATSAYRALTGEYPMVEYLPGISIDQLREMTAKQA